jgi:hypothetical protein
LAYPTTKAAARAQELYAIVENDRYPLSPRIRTLTGILAELRPELAHEPLPPPKAYAPPRATAARRRFLEEGRRGTRALIGLVWGYPFLRRALP